MKSQKILVPYLVKDARKKFNEKMPGKVTNPHRTRWRVEKRVTRQPRIKAAKLRLVLLLNSTYPSQAVCALVRRLIVVYIADFIFV